MGLRAENIVLLPKVTHYPIGIEFGNTDQEYDVDGTTWVSAVAGGTLGGIPDEESSGHKLADCLAATSTAVDGSYLAVRENSGAASATNPLTVQFLFTNVAAFNRVLIREQYTGSLSHNVAVELWDYVNEAFVRLEDISDQLYNKILDLNTLCATCFIGTGANAGKVLLQIIHTSSGSTAHTIELEYVALMENG